MKGFPNQVADLGKIAVAIRALARLVDGDRDARDDTVFGEALIRAGVAGTGHTPRPIDEYLSEQRQKPRNERSHGATARGLRELLRRMGLIDDSGARVFISEPGRQAASFAGSSMNAEQIEFWRTVIRNMIHNEPDEEASHPYQVLLRLVARRPGITRAKCALALEARDDSAEELDRIVALADLDEEVIRRQIGVKKSNWDNAQKILPRFAEQLGDVVKQGRSFTLAAGPGDADAGPAQTLAHSRARVPRPIHARPPSTSRLVTPDTIARAGAEGFDEVAISPDLDPAAAQAAIRQRLARLGRHNAIVRAFGARLSEAGARLYEDPFDALALFGEVGVLAEMKSLNGSPADERDRVMEALSQLLYYEAFVTASVAGEAAIHKIACFEAPITAAHQKWLNNAGIGSLWQLPHGSFGGDALAANVLGDYIEELR